MRLPFVPLFAVLVLLFAHAAHAAPSNDNRANAIALPSSNQVGARGHNIGARSEAFERGFYNALQNVWYKWTPAVTDEAVLNVIGNYDPTVAVFEQQEDESLVFIEYDDDGGDGLNSRATFTATAGKTYFIAVDGFPGIRVAGTFLISILQTDVISDSFAGKKSFVGSLFTAAGNNSSFTLETDEPAHGTATTLQEGRSGWISWTPVSRSQVTLDTKGSFYDTLLAVYTGDAINNLTLIAKADDVSSTDRTSQLGFVAEPGVTYHFAVAGKNTGAGITKINLKATKLPPGIKLSTRRLVVYNGDSGVISATTFVTGDPTYRWQIRGPDKRWTDLNDSVEYTGVTTTTLTINFTDLSMDGTYYRLVASDSVGTSYSAPVLLTVTEFPAVLNEVLGTIEMDLSIGGVPAPSDGGTYFAVGLPKGLTIDPATGVLSGVITARPGTYLVTYGSTTGRVRNPEQFVLQIVVAPFSSYFTGPFEALLYSSGSVNVPHGKLTLKVATTGSFTGTYFVLEDGKAYSFRSTVALNQNNRTAGITEATPLTISRGRGKDPILLAFSLIEPSLGGEEDVYTILTAQVWNAADELLGEALDGAAVSRFTAASPAPWAATYTARLPITAPADELPLGAGYATASIAPNTGALSLRGRLADNTPFTANLASSQQATYRLGQRVYAPGGSLAGRINLIEHPGSDAAPSEYHADSSSESALHWVKPTRVKDKLYPDGFGPVSLTFLMAPWSNPAGDFPKALGLAAVGDIKINIDAVVDNDGNNALTTEVNFYGLPIDTRIGATGALSFVTPVSPATKFTFKVNAATGAFTGSYHLVETEIIPPAKKPVDRTVPFSGVLFQPTVTFLGDVIGEGFAIVPPFDAAEKPTSALIQILAGPPDSPFKIEDE